MKPFVLIIAVIALLSMECTAPSNQQADSPENADNYQLKKVFEEKFYVGTAMSGRQLSGDDPAAVNLIKSHFNAITAENVMKSGPLQPREGEFNFGPSDAFVEFGEAHDMHIVGHNLIWHSQAPDWFFTDEQGKDISPELLKQRMESHIKTVVGRYKGRIHGWDVVNEAILNDGSYRESKFYQILGEEYIPLAFTFAHEADPEAALYYNDYSMANPGKRAGVVAMVQQLQEKGIKIDGIGMQGHVGMDYPSLEAFENSILAYANLGVDVMITELDLSVLPSPNNEASAEITATEAYQKALNPYTEGLPDKMSARFTERYLGLFTLFLKHEDKITRVTTWGVSDRNSWKNNWPIRGRTDYPLLFDRDYQPKAIVHALAILAADE